jgi:hypothetical protein
MIVFPHEDAPADGEKEGHIEISHRRLNVVIEGLHESVDALLPILALRVAL